MMKKLIDFYLIVHTRHPHLLPIGNCESNVLKILATFRNILSNSVFALKSGSPVAEGGSIQADDLPIMRDEVVLRLRGTHEVRECFINVFPIIQVLQNLLLQIIYFMMSKFISSNPSSDVHKQEQKG